MSVLAMRTGQDARGLWQMLHSAPRVFDSLWYATERRSAADKTDIDRIREGA